MNNEISLDFKQIKFELTELKKMMQGVGLLRNDKAGLEYFRRKAMAKLKLLDKAVSAYEKNLQEKQETI